jgi:hypothetical protein
MAVGMWVRVRMIMVVFMFMHINFLLAAVFRAVSSVILPISTL